MDAHYLDLLGDSLPCGHVKDFKTLKFAQA